MTVGIGQQAMHNYKFLFKKKKLVHLFPYTTLMQLCHGNFGGNLFCFVGFLVLQM